jgi:hypothetical protein
MASYWPEESERVTIPILLPDFVRHSARSSTVAASLPAEAPCFTARAHDAVIVTRDFGGFSDCNLSLVDPWAAS